MSYRAIAAALALEDHSIEQRLTALTLASFANREQRAWPSVATAAARAGLTRARYIATRGDLERRGLIELDSGVDDHGRHSATARLVFAQSGPSIEREINPARLDAALTASSSRGGTRLLLAVLAALSDEDGLIEDLSVEEICDAGGLSDSTYRRARTQLLQAGEIELAEAGGGRSRCNHWRIAISDTRAELPASQVPHSVAGSMHGARAGRRPLTADGDAPSSCKAWPRTRSQTPPETPPQTPSSRARGGKESQKQRIRPPDPPSGGHRDGVVLVEDFVTPRGRRRSRQVIADPAAELSPIAAADHTIWATCRDQLRAAVGDSAFEIWLADLELFAVSRTDGALLVTGRPETARWVDSRYGRLLASVAARTGRAVRVASDREQHLGAVTGNEPPSPSRPATSVLSPLDHQEVS